MSEWPVVVARPLTGSESIQMQVALSARSASLASFDAGDALGAIRDLIDALDEGRICIEAEDEPTAEDVRDDRDVINDDAWEAAKEGRL